MAKIFICAGLCALVIACGAPSPRDAGTIGVGSSPSGDGHGDSGFTAEGTGEMGSHSDSGDEAGEDGNAKFDLESPDGGDDIPTEPGCHKIDFLFIIDNSTSMQDEQANLIANFGDFIDGIQSTLVEVDDYHVGVVTTDAYAANEPGCKELGGLVTRTGGADSSASACGPYAEGHRFMTEQDDLDATFSCAAQVGTVGWPLELPMDALSAVLDGGPAGCNDGFLRSDALLVAVIITDEWDGPADPEIFGSSGDPAAWYGDVLDHKSFEENVAIVSLLNYEGGPCVPAEPTFDGKHIKTFTEMFPYGFVGGVCSDYGPIFGQAVDIVDEACKNFLPPG